MDGVVFVSGNAEILEAGTLSYSPAHFELRPSKLDAPIDQVRMGRQPKTHLELADKMRAGKVGDLAEFSPRKRLFEIFGNERCGFEKS